MNMRSHRGRLNAIVSIVCFCGILLLAFLPCVSEPPPSSDDSDLDAGKNCIPAEQIAFKQFCQATNYFYWPTNQWGQKYQMWELVGGTNWQEDVVTEILTSNKQALALFKQGLACDAWYIERPDSLFAYQPELQAVGQAVDLMNVDTKAHCRRQEWPSALSNTIQLAHLSGLLQTSGGGLMTWLRGLRIPMNDITAVLTNMPLNSISAADLKLCAEALSHSDRLEASYVPALKDNYQQYLSALRRVDDRHITIQEFLGGAYGDTYRRHPSTASILASRVIVSLAFDYEETRAMFADRTRLLLSLKGMNHSSARAKLNESPITWPERIHSRREAIGRLLGHNAVGRLFTISTQYEIRYHLWLCKAESRLRGCRLIVAVQRYRKDHEAFPPDLQALVPNYMDSVPMDPFDGKPMRYSREKHLIYSVGEDLSDAGGISHRQTKRKHDNYNLPPPLDILFPIPE